MKYPGEVPVFRGSRGYLAAPHTPVKSDAAADLVSRAMARREARGPLYVAALAALTNIASALLLEPEIVRRIVVVWLGVTPMTGRNRMSSISARISRRPRLFLIPGFP
jgi:inosine-uridine nucleoside N-ribohydrolase